MKSWDFAKMKNAKFPAWLFKSRNIKRRFVSGSLVGLITNDFHPKRL